MFHVLFSMVVTQACTFVKIQHAVPLWVLCYIYTIYIYKIFYVCLCMLSHVQLFVTLGTIASQTPLSMGFSRQRIPEWIAISFSRESSWLRDWTHVSWGSRIGKQILYHWHWAIWEAHMCVCVCVCVCVCFLNLKILIQKFFKQLKNCLREDKYLVENTKFCLVQRIPNSKIPWSAQRRTVNSNKASPSREHDKWKMLNK